MGPLAGVVALMLATACTSASEDPEKEHQAAGASSPTPTPTPTASNGPLGRLTTLTTRDGLWPVLATGPRGDSHAVWASGPRLQVRSAAPDGVWGPVQDLAGSAAGSAILPAVDTAGDGTVTVVWVDDRYGGGGAFSYQILASTRRPGAAWSRPVELLPAPRRYLDLGPAHLVLGVGAGGHAAVAWSDQDNPGLWASYRTPRGRWTEPTVLDAQSYASTVDVAVSPQGIASYVYPGADTGELVVSQRTETGWRAAVRVATDVSPPTSFVADDAGPGGLVVAWVADRRAVRYARLTGPDRSSWEDGGYLQHPTDLQAHDLVLDASREGATVFGWVLGPAHGELWTAYQAGGAKGPGESTMVTNRGGSPMVAVDSIGAAAGWVERSDLFYSHRGEEQGAQAWIDPIQVNTSPVDALGWTMSASTGGPTTTMAWEKPGRGIESRTVSASP